VLPQGGAGKNETIVRHLEEDIPVDAVNVLETALPYQTGTSSI
jgi:hypothetical protein